MKFEEYHFMQLFGNCACIAYLGENRVRGPVDNVNCINIKLIDLLLNKEYLNALCTSKYKKVPRKKDSPTDSEWQYEFSFVWIVHNDPTTVKYQTALQKRLEVFYEFYSKVKTDKNYYFVISLNRLLMNKRTHLINNKSMSELINKLKALHILDKCIFVGNKLKKKHNNWDYWAKDFSTYIDNYNLKYIEIIDLSFTEDADAAFRQFKEKVLVEINKKKKINMTKSKKRENISYYLYY